MKDVLKQVIKFGKELLTLKNQVEKNTLEAKEIRQDLHELTKAVQGLTYVVQRNQENYTHEMEKLVLRLENYLLKYTRQLPMAGDNDVDFESQDDSRILPPKL